MYRHYESSEDVFVDREEHIEWMNDALERCKKKSVVLHLKGIGGIGKSSLLNYWINTHEKTIRLDCEQYTEFYQRLNMLAKGAVLQGVKLQRFDLLWQIRQRFVEGVEPVREEGRQWAKEVVMAIPFIGSLASIGSAITAVGAKVTPKLKGKYGPIGKWLQETLGKNYIEQLLEILWKDPRRAEFLYLSAFLEDINNRDSLGTPIIFLLDHFEYVDNEKTQWRYSGKRISETELWTLFLFLLSNCVGVMASRRAVVKGELQIEETELLELDKDSCVEMLKLQGVVDENLQERIVSVSGGNPFVVDSICDMINTSDVSISDIEGLKADTLADVRLKVWRRLFSQAEGLLDIINRAGLVPFFTKDIIEMITPTFTSDYWDRMIRLSFVKDQGDGTYVLHDLAEDLAKAELGSRLKDLAKEIARFLREGYEATNDYTLLGMSYNAEAYASLAEVCEKILYKSNDFSWKAEFKEAISFLDVISIDNDFARAVVNICRGWHLTFLNRITEGEQAADSAIESFRTMEGISDKERNRFLAISLMYSGAERLRLGREDEPEELLQEASELYQMVVENPPESMMPGRELLEEVGILTGFGDLMYSKWEFQKARQYYLSSLEKLEKWATIEKQMSEEEINREIALNLWNLGMLSNSVNQLSDAEAFSRRGLEISKTPISVIQHLMILGTSLKLRGHLKESKEMKEKEIELSKRMTDSSTEFPRYLGSLMGLHEIQSLSGEYHQAIQTVEQLLLLIKDYVEKAPEIYLPDSVAYHRMHGNSLRKIGNLSKARLAFQNSIELAEEYIKLTGPMNKGIRLKPLNDFGVLLYQIGDMMDAEVCFREAIEICRWSLNEFPASTIRTRQLSTCLCNLGALMLESGREKEAKEVLKESLSLRRRIQNEAPEVFYYHSYIASSMNNLAVLNAISGKYEDAEEHLSKAIDLRLRHRTEETSETFNPGLVAVHSNIGMLKTQSGDVNGSKDAFSKAIETARELYERNPETHRRALIKALSNMYLVSSDGDAEGNLAMQTLAELRQLGYEGIPDQLNWFVETSEMF